MTGKTVIAPLDVVRYSTPQWLSKDNLNQVRQNLLFETFLGLDSVGLDGASVSQQDPTAYASDTLFAIEGTTQAGGSTLIFNGAVTDSQIMLPYFSRWYNVDGFNGNTNIVTVYLPPCINEIVNSAFEDCTNLTHINFPDTIVGINSSAFKNSGLANEIVMPRLATSINVSVFEGTSITSLDSGASVTDIFSSAMLNCGSLATVTLREGLEEIGPSAFSGCAALDNVVLPSTITDLGNSVFNGCTNLASLSILSVEPPTEGTGMFTGTALTEIHVREGSNFGATYDGITVVADL